MLRTALVLVAGLGLAAALYACGASAEPTAPAVVEPIASQTPRPSVPGVGQTPAAKPSPISAAPAIVDPLCGRPVSDAALLNRHPLAVKIDNIADARPQSGLSEACVVYEHLTEWDITRFTAIYYAEEPESLGPIRSARLLDISLAKEYDGLLAHVGASAPVMERIRNSGIKDLDQYHLSPSDPTYHRIKSRVAPFNVYTSSALLRKLAAGRGWGDTKPLPTRPFLLPGEKPAGSPAKAISIPFSKANIVQYRYDEIAGAYARSVAGAPQIDEVTGKQILATNVIVQYVKYVESDFEEDANQAPSRDVQLVGEGRAQVLHSGQIQDVRWSRPSADKLTQFLDAAGRPLPLKPGNIWIELAPLDMQVTVQPTAK